MYRNQSLPPKPVPPVAVDSYSDMSTGRSANNGGVAFSTGSGQTMPAPEWYTRMLDKRTITRQSKYQNTQDSYGSRSQNFGQKPRGLLNFPENPTVYDSPHRSRGLLDPPNATLEFTDSTVSSRGLLDLPSSSNEGLLAWSDSSKGVLDPQTNYGASLGHQGSYRGLLNRPESSRALLETPPSLLQNPDRSHSEYSTQKPRSKREPSSPQQYDYLEKAEPQDYYYQQEQQQGNEYETYETSPLGVGESTDMNQRKSSIKNQTWEVEQTGETYNDLIQRAQAFSQENISLKSSATGVQGDGYSSKPQMSRSHRQVKSLFSMESAFQSKPVSSQEGSRAMSISPVDEMEPSEEFHNMEKSIYNGPAGQLVTNYYCKVCKIRANSMKNFDLHCEGRQHNKIVSELRAFLGPEFARTYGNPNEPNVCREPLDQDNDDSQYEDSPSKRVTQVKPADASVPAFQTNVQRAILPRVDYSNKRDQHRERKERSSATQGHGSGIRAR